DKRMIIVHQQDPGLAQVFKKAGYDSILDSEDNIRSGKAEGMIIGLLMAKIYNKDYVGFIDSDNYVPGAVNEYVKIFAAGFGMSTTPYCNVRVSWVFKPKVKNNSLQFSKWGRVSEITNRNLNSLLATITGFETDIIKTGNAGEHALSMPLAECLQYTSGYSIETREFIDIFEKFGGLEPSKYPQIVEKGVEVFQIETRNPHFHEDKGMAHLNEMLEASLATIFGSKICPQDLKETLLDQLKHTTKKKTDYNKKYHVLDPINTIHMPEFEKGVREKAQTFQKIGRLK
ncbi:MAG TPA: mannosyl-3-phosphoglycerate synthase, partial [Nitrososphaera sp.]|nr:mannosyl-3-phosphoglycerate synthase [Nitrososphaera sp.]